MGDVDSVAHRTADALLVLAYLSRAALAFPFRRAAATRARIGSQDQLETCRELRGTVGTSYRDLATLERLSQGVVDGRLELRCLVEKQDAGVVA